VPIQYALIIRAFKEFCKMKTSGTCVEEQVKYLEALLEAAIYDLDRDPKKQEAVILAAYAYARQCTKSMGDGAL
jgi:hypothetical protein